MGNENGKLTLGTYQYGNSNGVRKKQTYGNGDYVAFGSPYIHGVFPERV